MRGERAIAPSCRGDDTRSLRRCVGYDVTLNDFATDVAPGLSSQEDKEPEQPVEADVRRGFNPAAGPLGNGEICVVKLRMLLLYRVATGCWWDRVDASHQWPRCRSDQGSGEVLCLPQNAEEVKNYESPQHVTWCFESRLATLSRQGVIQAASSRSATSTFIGASKIPRAPSSRISARPSAGAEITRPISPSNAPLMTRTTAPSSSGSRGRL